MALTLDATLSAAQDSDSRHPLVEIISAQKGDDIPFDGTYLTPETFNEYSPSVIAHSSGRLCLAYCYGPDADDDCGIKYVYTDTSRTQFETVTIELYTDPGYEMKSVSICEMTDGNIGIVCLVDNVSSHVYRLLRRIVTVDGVAVSNAEIANWSHDTYTSDPWVSTIAANSYLLVYGKAYTTGAGTNYFMYQRTSADFATWEAETLTTIDIDEKAVMSLTIATAECTENEGTYNLIFTGANTTPATGTYAVVWYVKTLSIDDSDCIEADGTYDLIFTGANTTPATGTYTIASNVITDVDITDGGTGYAVAPTVATQTGDGSVSTTLGKKITSTTLTGGGTGYAANPTVATQSGSGSITALISIKRLANPSILKITTGDLWLWFDALESTGPGGEELTNVYYSVSADAGVNWANAVKVTNYTLYGEIGLHPTACQKVADTMHLLFNRRVGALHMDDTATGWPTGDSSYELSWDSVNRKLYVINCYAGGGSKYLECVVKIDVDTWTVDQYWDETTTPGFPSFLTDNTHHIWYNNKMHDGHHIAICCVENDHRFVWHLDGELDTITGYYLDTQLTHSITKNTTIDTLDSHYVALTGLQVDADNSRIYVWIVSTYLYNSGVYVGYIDLTETSDYAVRQIIYVDTMFGVDDAYIQGCSNLGDGGFYVDVAGQRLIITGTTAGTWDGFCKVYDMESAGELSGWTDADTDFPKYGLRKPYVYGDKLYAGLGKYYSGGTQATFRGLCEIDLETEIITFHRPSYCTEDDHLFGRPFDIGDDRLAMTHPGYGVAVFDMIGHTWELYSNDNIPGMTLDGNDTWADAQIAYDATNEIIFVGDPGDGVVAFSTHGFLRQSYYSLGTFSGGAWSFGTAAQLVQGFRDFDAVAVPDPGNATSMYCFWDSESVDGEQSIKWDKDGSSLDLSPYLLDEEIVLSRTIDGNPATLEFSVSHGHLFDPYNQTSLLTLYLRKGRKLTVRWGELISGTEYWQNAGTFYVMSGAIPIQRGVYPTMKVEAHDQRALWQHGHVYATDIYANTPEEILSDLMTDIADLALTEIDIPTFDNSTILYNQWIETTLDEILTEVCERFGYYYRFDVDGKFSARKITNAGAIDHTYTDQTKIIQYSPDDKYSDFTNRVTVMGQERDYTTVLFDEEQVATLQGTLGWWGCKKEHTVWFSTDQSRRCMYPRLVIIETTLSIPMRLAGNVEESLDECGAGDDFKFCTVNVKAPNLIGPLLSSVLGYVALCSIPDMGYESDSVVYVDLPWGRLAQSVVMTSICMILGSVANYQYAIWARPLGSSRRSVQGQAEDKEHQAEIGCVVEQSIEDALCYSVADCNQVAAFELMVAKMQRKRVSLQKIAHLQDEDGDTIRIVHPYSGADIDLFVTNIRRRYKKGKDGYFIDEVDGWVTSQ